jgi:CheY-like chemotaxis protein
VIDLAHAFQPRLEVLDINMRGMDAFETAKQLKQPGWARHAGFVAHTRMRREAASYACSRTSTTFSKRVMGQKRSRHR